MIKILKNGIVTNAGPDQEWLDKHIAMGTFGDDFEVVEEFPVDNSAQEKINADSLKYLAETDYLLIREFETGILCPEEVKAKRQEARDAIVKL